MIRRFASLVLVASLFACGEVSLHVAEPSLPAVAQAPASASPTSPKFGFGPSSGGFVPPTLNGGTGGGSVPADTIEGTLTSGDLTVATGLHTIGNYAGASCAAGSALSALSAAGIGSCSSFLTTTNVAGTPNTTAMFTGPNTIGNGPFTVSGSTISTADSIATTGTGGLTVAGTSTFSAPIVSANSSTSALREEYLGTDTQGNIDNTNGPAWRLGINQTGRRSIMLVDMGASALNTTNTGLDFTVGTSQGAEIDAVSTGWSVSQPLTINASSTTIGSGTFTSTAGTTALGVTNVSGLATFSASGTVQALATNSGNDTVVEIKNTSTGGRDFLLDSGGNASSAPNVLSIFDQTGGTFRAKFGATTLTLNNLSTDTLTLHGATTHDGLVTASAGITSTVAANTFDATTISSGDLTVTSGNLGVTAGTVTAGSNVTTGGSFIFNGATGFAFGLNAASTGNQDFNIAAAGTGTIKLNSNTGALANSGTGGVQLYGGANGTTVKWSVTGAGNETTTGTLGVTGLTTLTGGATTPASITITSTGHIKTQGTSVTLTNATCSSTTCNDIAGTVTTTATSMQITFAGTYTGSDDADCILQEIGGSVAPTFTTSATILSATTVASGAKYHYICLGH